MGLVDRNSHLTLEPMLPEPQHTRTPSDPKIEDLHARQEEFVRLFARYEPMALGFVVTLVSSWDDATEIMQEASVVAWRKFDEFQPGTNFLSWLCHIAELKVRGLYTRRKRERLQFNDELVSQSAEMQLEVSVGALCCSTAG
jgi:RNA polymerase sigma-70 factor (ECF subfamily)